MSILNMQSAWLKLNTTKKQGHISAQNTTICHAIGGNASHKQHISQDPLRLPFSFFQIETIEERRSRLDALASLHRNDRIECRNIKYAVARIPHETSDDRRSQRSAMLIPCLAKARRGSQELLSNTFPKSYSYNDW